VLASEEAAELGRKAEREDVVVVRRVEREGGILAWKLADGAYERAICEGWLPQI